MKRHRHSASALIITLALLVLISILVVGFVATARLDVVSSQSHLNGFQAEIFAQMGEEAALAKLKATTLASKRSWISEPGALVVSPTGTNQPLATSVDLSSGWSSTLPASNDETVDLNPALLANTNDHLLAPSSVFGTNLPEMRVRWIYVRSDGTFDTNSSPAYDGANPLKGRFAYWADDESAKIDINTAWTRNAANTNTSSHPSLVGLDALLGASETANLSQYRLNQYFNSPDEIKRVDTNMATPWSTNRFALTHYSHSPELNMFGEQRILLTTQKSIAESIYGVGTTNYLDILTTPNTDPGNRDSGTLNYTKIKQVMARLNQLLARTDWPIAPGKNFTTKYAPGGDTSRTAQLALDLIEYVRSKESTNESVEPLRVDNTFTPVSGSGDYAQGFTRRALLSEIGVWYGTNANQGAYYKIEVYLPKGGSRINLTNQTLVVQSTKTLTVQPPNVISAGSTGIPIQIGPPPASPTAVNNEMAYLDSSDPYLVSGSYRVITAYTIPWVGGSTRPTSVELRVSLGLDLSTVNQGVGNNIIYNVDPTNVPFSQITSVAVADPVVNKQHSNWVQGTNTFLGPNVTPSASVAWGPAQDTDSSGTNIYPTGAWMPPPKGQPGNLSGLVESVGELGYLPTGLECYSTAGVPWRTLHLQPESNAGSFLPDWAFLDLFAAPVAVSASDKPLVYPHTNGSTGGRVNLNAGILPFQDASGNFSMMRPEALMAVLNGARLDYSGTNILSTAQALPIFTNIFRKTPAVSDRAYGNTNIYYSPWQVAEIAGVAGTGEESEALVRDIGNLTTVRGNVFSVYSVGQAIQQSKSGKITVLGERRYQRMVERANKPGTSTLSYETVFSRSLLP